MMSGEKALLETRPHRVREELADYMSRHLKLKADLETSIQPNKAQEKPNIYTEAVEAVLPLTMASDYAKPQHDNSYPLQEATTCSNCSGPLSVNNTNCHVSRNNAGCQEESANKDSQQPLAGSSRMTPANNLFQHENSIVTEEFKRREKRRNKEKKNCSSSPSLSVTLQNQEQTVTAPASIASSPHEKIVDKVVLILLNILVAIQNGNDARKNIIKGLINVLKLMAGPAQD